MGSQCNWVLAKIVYSMKCRVKYYNFLKWRIEREITNKKMFRDKLAKDEGNLNLKWARNIIMEKDFDNLLVVNEDGEMVPNPEIAPMGDLPKENSVHIIEAPGHLSSKAKKYPPPRTTPIFMKKWYQLINDVSANPMFKKSHLSQLEMLCEMHEDLEICMNYMRTQGFSYVCMTANTRQMKAYPEVAIAAKLRTEIRNMYKQLGLGSGKEVALSNSGDDDWS